MTVTKRQVMWPLLLMSLGLVWLLLVAGMLPDAVGDILWRSWPALLFFFGLDVLLGRRQIRLFGRGLELSVVGIVISLALLAGMVVAAYDRQADVLRADNVQRLVQELGADIAQLEIRVQGMRTSVALLPDEEDGQALLAEFAGSRESDVTLNWQVEDATGILVVEEARLHSLPRLEDVGRGTLKISLPAGIRIENVSMEVQRGDITLDLGQWQVGNVDLSTGAGDIWLSLPELDVMQGRAESGGGNIELVVPSGKALDVKLEPGSGEPEYVYDSFRYDLLRDGELKLKNAIAFDYALDVHLRSGAILRVTDLP